MRSHRVFMLSAIIALNVLAAIAGGCITITAPAPPTVQTPTDVPVKSDVPPASAGLPVIISFKASPQQIVAGTYSTLAWNVSGAATVFIDQGIGAVSASGSKEVSPTANTIYTLVAENSAGSIKGTATVSMASSLNAATVALTPDDVKAKGWEFDSTKQPIAENADSTYSITFKKGEELLTNSVFVYPSTALAEQRYFIGQSQYRSSAQNIYSLGEVKAYVVQDTATENKPERFSIRFVKTNVYVELGSIYNYKEIEAFAKLLEMRIHY